MKYNRHAKILEIIEKHEIETQEEIAEKLKEVGMDVTQATISRDIKELRLVKIMTEGSKNKYSVFSHNQEATPNRLLNVFYEAYISSDYANNIVVVKTLPGMAQAVASTIDSMKWPQILGSIAGDDAIMIVCMAEKIAEELVEKFNEMIK